MAVTAKQKETFPTGRTGILRAALRDVIHHHRHPAGAAAAYAQIWRQLRGYRRPSETSAQPPAAPPDCFISTPDIFRVSNCWSTRCTRCCSAPTYATTTRIRLRSDQPRHDVRPAHRAAKGHRAHSAHDFRVARDRISTARRAQLRRRARSTCACRSCSRVTLPTSSRFAGRTANTVALPRQNFPAMTRSC